MSDTMLSLRCSSRHCKKLLGKVDEDMVLHIESSRRGFWIKIELHEGFVTCKQCGTRVKWSRKTKN